jgi:hypothetical protein
LIGYEKLKELSGNGIFIPKINRMLKELFENTGTATAETVITFQTIIDNNAIQIFRNNNLGLQIGDTVKLFQGLGENNLIFQSEITEILDQYSWEDRAEINIADYPLMFDTQYRLKAYRNGVLYGISEIYLINS